MGVILFNGKSSVEYGIIVEKFPSINHGAKRAEAYQIAGKNGTYYREDGTYDNFVQAYLVSIKEGAARRADLRSSDMAEWLLNSPAFCRLEDSWEPEYFKMARYAGPLNIEQIMGAYGKCTLEFDCLPERWLKSGEQELDISVTGTIHNPTKNTAYPILKTTKIGDVTVAVDGVNVLTVGVSESGVQTTVIIDCENGTIQTSAGVDLYGSTTFYTDFHEFPKIPPGNHTITASGTGTVLIVRPRWYVL